MRSFAPALAVSIVAGCAQDAPFTQQAYVKASNAEPFASFGTSVALSADGNTLAVGAASEQSATTGIDGNQTDYSCENAGAVYIFARINTTWTQQAYVKASNTGAGDRFGTAVALSSDGNTLAVGAMTESSGAIGINGNETDNSAQDSGAAYVFVRTDTSWAQEAYIKPSNTDRLDAFGTALALSADGATLAVGAPMERSAAVGIDGNQADNSMGNSGAVYVFTRSGTTWTQNAYVKASNTGMMDEFGQSVSLSADGATLAVGAWLESSAATGIDGNQDDDSATESGAAYVFARSGSSWSQQAYVKASNTDDHDFFGESVTLSADGSTLAVGAPTEASAATGINGKQNNNSADGAGAVYLFARTATAWAQKAYVKATNTVAGDAFGGSVSLSADGRMLGIGASLEDRSGAAYLLAFDGAKWSHLGYVKASNAGGDDAFGAALALSADATTLAVGAYAEESKTSGINGDQSDDSLFVVGAAYVFVAR